MRSLNVANESIDFQTGSMFFKELTLAFTELKDTKKDAIEDSDIIPRLCKIVGHHTGLNVAFNIGMYEPSVEIPAVDKNNPLINSFIRNYVSSADGIKMIGGAGGVVRGTASLKTGKVSGIFTEVKSTINLPINMFTGKAYEPEEIAAITLHEVGHLFTYYEYITRTVTTNQVLAGISKGLDQSGTVEEREAVLISAKKALGLSALDIKELAKSRNNKVSEIVVVSNVAKDAASELGSNIYDFSTWESLADAYAARQGAGRHLVTALDKIYHGYWSISFRSLPAFLAWEAFKLITLVVVPGISIMFIVMDGSGDGTYDVPGARIKRVRNQIVENLKDKKLTKDDHERLVADLESMDSILSQINDRRQFVEVVWNVLSPTSRKGLSAQRLQQELESLAANDLFIKAAEMKQLA